MFHFRKHLEQRIWGEEIPLFISVSERVQEEMNNIDWNSGIGWISMSLNIGNLKGLRSTVGYRGFLRALCLRVQSYDDSEGTSHLMELLLCLEHRGDFGWWLSMETASKTTVWKNTKQVLQNYWIGETGEETGNILFIVFSIK